MADWFREEVIFDVAEENFFATFHDDTVFVDDGIEVDEEIEVEEELEKVEDLARDDGVRGGKSECETYEIDEDEEDEVEEDQVVPESFASAEGTKYGDVAEGFFELGLVLVESNSHSGREEELRFPGIPVELEYLVEMGVIGVKNFEPFQVKTFQHVYSQPLPGLSE